MFNGEVECMGNPHRTKEGPEDKTQCYWHPECENLRPILSDDYSVYSWTMHELCEINGNCPARCGGGWCVVVKEAFLYNPDYHSTCNANEIEETTPEPTTTVTDPLMGCVTEWRCVPRGDDIIVARLNHGNVECMERPNASKDGQCYWGAECDETMRPRTYVENYWTMDQLCELRGNCPARCNGGWCKVVKDTFMDEPEYSQCAAEYDMFVVNGDCKVEDECVSSSNYPQSYERGESCMVTLKEDLFLTPGFQFEISDSLRSGDVDIVSTLQMPTYLSAGSSITWLTQMDDSDSLTTEAGRQVCFTREEPPAQNDRFHIEGDGCVADTFGCVYTKNYPYEYEANDQCTIHVTQDSNLQANRDLDLAGTLIIAEQDVDDLEQIPDVIGAGDTISWSADSEVPALGLGWQLCFSEFESVANCVTEWRCVDTGDGRILVARLNHGNVECMEKPNPRKDGQCYQNAECDETMRPLIYTDNYWTMDQLCEIRGNCPAKCLSGWCAVVKDTFENDPEYSECAN